MGGLRVFRRSAGEHAEGISVGHDCAAPGELRVCRREVYYRMPLLVNLAICHPMTMQGEPISWQPLRADEVERLPSRLKSTLGDTIEAGDEWVVLRVHGREIGGVVEYMNRLYTMWHVPRVRGREAQHLEPAAGTPARRGRVGTLPGGRRARRRQSRTADGVPCVTYRRCRPRRCTKRRVDGPATSASRRHGGRERAESLRCALAGATAIRRSSFRMGRLARP